MSVVFLSVIICTRNRADELNDCLILVAEQAKIFNDVEILVVDNGSADNTGKIAENVAQKYKFPIRYIYEPIVGLCQARNRGREASRGKILAYIDDDVRIKDDWVAKIRQHFLANRSDCVGGKVSVRLGTELPFKSSKEMLWFFGETILGDEMREYRATDRPPYPVGCNMAFTTDLFDSVKGFNPHLKLYFDETDFFSRASEKNAKILYVPDIEVEQYIPFERLTRTELRYKTYILGNGAADFWLLSNPTLVQRIKRFGASSIKFFYHAVRYSVSLDFGKFFAFWFNFGYITQLFKKMERKSHNER